MLSTKHEAIITPDISNIFVTIQLTNNSPYTCFRKYSPTAAASAAFPPRLKVPTIASLKQISVNLNIHEAIYNYAE